jgi:hypothetical protein
VTDQVRKSLRYYRPSFRDALCDLARNYLLGVELERRNIKNSVIRMAELTAKFEFDLMATRELERTRTADPVPEDAI